MNGNKAGTPPPTRDTRPRGTRRGAGTWTTRNQAQNPQQLQWVLTLVDGVAMLLASVMAGWLWDASGPAATFIAGAVFATGAGLVLVFQATRRAASSRPS